MSVVTESDEDVDIDLGQLLQGDVRKNVAFEERLKLVGCDGELMDEVTVAVEDSSSATDDQVSVYQYSHQGGDVLMRIRSQVKCADLVTGSELRKIMGPDKSNLLRITEVANIYTVFQLQSEGSEYSRTRREIEIPKEPFLLEGANVLLLRILAQSGIQGQLKCQTINHSGELCDCVYEVELSDEIVRVTRTVTGPSDTQIMVTDLTRDGYILSHRWNNTKWSLVATTTPEECSQLLEERPESEAEPEVKVDKEAYFLKKEELLGIMNAYFRDNCDIQDLIADFLKNLFFDKPQDVIEFADQFFCNFVGINAEDHQPPTSSSQSEASDQNSEHL